MYLDPATDKIGNKIYYLVSFDDKNKPQVCGFCDGHYINAKRIAWLIEKKYKLTETESNFDTVKFIETL